MAASAPVGTRSQSMREELAPSLERRAGPAGPAATSPRDSNHCSTRKATSASPSPRGRERSALKSPAMKSRASQAGMASRAATTDGSPPPGR
eukprot:4046886-Alexandrium_andersonii.AAC.1